jgi:hypothetical protein
MKKEKKLPNKKVRLLLKNKENRLIWVTVDVKITKEYENRKGIPMSEFSFTHLFSNKESLGKIQSSCIF